MKKKVETEKIKQIETFEMLGVRYIVALTESGDIYQNTFGSIDWKYYPRPTVKSNK